MANILLTNICNQRCSYCFDQDRRDSSVNNFSIKNLKTVLDFLKKNKEKTIRLLGGEPTCHPHFKKIVNYILKEGFNVHIFTNGLFSDATLKFLAHKKDSVSFNFNVNEPIFYRPSQWKIIMNNIKKLSTKQKIILTINIFKPDFSYDHFVKIVENCTIRAIHIRITNPIQNQKNMFLSLKSYKETEGRIKAMIKALNASRAKKSFVLDFGCGLPRNLGIRLSRVNVGQTITKLMIRYGCRGNTGKFDISPDLHVYRCLPLSSWQKRKLSQFDTIEEINEFFSRTMKRYQQSKCPRDFFNNGPCFAYLLAGKQK